GAPLDSDRLMQVTAAVHNQVPTVAPGPGSTVAAAVAANASVAAAVSVPFRRLARPRGPLAARLATEPLRPPVRELDDATILRVTPEVAPVPGAVDLGRLSQTESLRTLTAQRMRTAVFPWEGATGAQAQVPFAFMCDLLVTTETDDRTLAFA